MMKQFYHFPSGQSIPENNPHAVSVSLPAIADVIAYEEEDVDLRNRMQSAYPRFRMNRYVEKVRDEIKKSFHVPDDMAIIPVASERALSFIESHFKRSFTRIDTDYINMILLEKDSDISITLKSFIQHTGLILSSRKAEDFLLYKGILEKEFSEERGEQGYSEKVIKQILADAYGSVSEEDILLCNAGTNAVYSVFEAVKKNQVRSNRNIIIQLGWLYLDTMEIIKKFSDKSIQYFNIMNLDKLESYLVENHSSVAAILTEVPTNPLIQTVDLPRLSQLSKKYRFPLIVDSTIGTPFNIEVMEFADIVVESLTKFACGNADLLMGAVLLNKNSHFAQMIKDSLNEIIETPYKKELMRMTAEIARYEERVKKIAENTLSLVDYLKKQKKIKHIQWALDDTSIGNYRKISKNNSTVPGLISIVFDEELKYYYDRLSLPKGPSFGTEFTLAMPYVYLAHYDLLKTDAGRRLLSSVGINPELLRISVGLETIDEIIKVFEEV